MLLRLDLLCLTAGPMAPAHPVFGGAGRWTPAFAFMLLCPSEVALLGDCKGADTASR